ncbi:hypothetical protein PAJ34TS1_37470 [Paenibacillus azoreducens]|uniref:Uncharacterized protein n=1 Tax=Paenibacillus azoreducens TaxID=116718 RepID=A0A919Y5L8_9BACL|nr:hypothetical protein J34TS1_01310 [Paenibacillus azoreducens]
MNPFKVVRNPCPYANETGERYINKNDADLDLTKLYIVKGRNTAE